MEDTPGPAQGAATGGRVICPNLGVTLDSLEVILAALGVILTVFAIFIAILALWGYREMKKAAVGAARHVVTGQIGDIAKTEVQNYMDMNVTKEVQSYMDMNLESQVQKYMDVNMSQSHEQESRGTEVIRDE